MSTNAQAKASKVYRERSEQKGLVRVEVQIPEGDRSLLKSVALILRENNGRADQLRAQLSASLGSDNAINGFDLFGSDLPDEVFSGVFEVERQLGWRPIDL